jgi:peptidyl-Lys metalloendopeptidase
MNSEGLSIRIDFEQPRYGKRALFKGEEGQMLSFTLTNDSETTLNVLKWHTPLACFDCDMFSVKKGGEQAVYIGPIVKWGAPKPEDYLTLEPKASESVQFDLSEAYDIFEAGDYSVQYKSILLDVGQEEPESLAKMASDWNEYVPIRASSNVAQFRLLESKMPRQLKGVAFGSIPQMAKISAKQPTFRNCTPDQEDILSNSLTEAVKIGLESKEILFNTMECARKDASRFTNWFGAYDGSRYDSAKSNFGKIWDALANKDVIFNAKCDPRYCSAYAYVYPASPYEIFLGNAFWRAPLNGTDSQAGTIVHETSHFYAVVGTNDHVYGQSGCQQLAANDPERSINNADSHEYFAENNPQRDMGADQGSVFVTASFWRDMPSGFQGGFNAALNGDGPFKGKCYFFKGDSYVRYDWQADRADPGFPRKIKDGWRGLPTGFQGSFNAAINGDGPFKGKCFFFKGNSYVRYDWQEDRIDPGYPKKIKDGWNNLPAGFKTGFGDLINGSGPFAGKCYIFKGDSYVRYDWREDRADPGYPAKIVKNWRRLPAGFERGFDAALEGDGNSSHHGFIFKGRSFIRYNWNGDCAES